MVGFPYLETFKVWLGGVLRNLNSLNISLLIAGALDQLSFKDCFQSRLSYDSAHLLLAASFKLPLQTRKCSPPCSCHKASTLSKENCSTSFHEKKKKIGSIKTNPASIALQDFSNSSGTSRQGSCSCQHRALLSRSGVSKGGFLPISCAGIQTFMLQADPAPTLWP